MVLRLSALASVAVAALAAGGTAFAQTPPIVPTPAPTSPAEDDDEVILKADQFEEDRDSSVVTASGNVEVRIGQRTLRADRVIYDRTTETLRAQGHVQITDGAGQVQFADEIEADEDFTNGFATRFSARLGELVGEVASLKGSGASLLGLAALGERNAPRYHRGIAEQLVTAGMPIAALSPLELARWVGEKLRGAQ